MPTSGAGPGSATRESNFPGRTGRTGVFVSSVQCSRSIDEANPVWSLPSLLVPRKYIQYLPRIIAGTIAPDFVHFTFQFPLFAGMMTPLRSQWIRSFEVARQS